ncbi:transposable element Tcb1 transposase [Trichonephila clavipes]|nr:transposable element Tcb1 transposase [Trichonephila clavipes]
MAFLGKGKKQDMLQLAEELGINATLNMTVPSTKLQSLTVRVMKRNLLKICMRLSLKMGKGRRTSTSNTLGRSGSEETVRRVLRKAGYNGRVARKKPLIGKRNRVKRLKFTKEHILKPQQFWNEVLFSDESKFNIFGSDGRRMVWRKPNTLTPPRNTQLLL